MKNDSIAQRLENLHQQIHEAEQNFGRLPHVVQLLAVSKTQEIQAIIEAYQAGQNHFGENYLQEALIKIEALKNFNLTWHFIGHIQSNKTRKIAQNFQWVHSLSSEKIARRLNAQRPPHLQPLNSCIEINIDADPNKNGILLDNLSRFVKIFPELPRLRLRGLMTIPSETHSFEEQKIPYRQLHQAFVELRAQGYQVDTLSMGMSNDFIAAIAEGSTIIRIGTAIFGSRTPK